MLKNFGGLNAEDDNTPGQAYSLLLANCQSFSKQLIRKMRKDFGWTSPKRLEHRFVLGDLEKEIRKGIIHDLTVRDIRAVSAVLRTRWTPFI